MRFHLSVLTIKKGRAIKTSLTPLLSNMDVIKGLYVNSMKLFEKFYFTC